MKTILQGYQEISEVIVIVLFLCYRTCIWIHISPNNLLIALVTLITLVSADLGFRELVLRYEATDGLFLLLELGVDALVVHLERPVLIGQSLFIPLQIPYVTLGLGPRRGLLDTQGYHKNEYKYS